MGGGKDAGYAILMPVQAKFGSRLYLRCDNIIPALKNKQATKKRPVKMVSGVKLLSNYLYRCFTEQTVNNNCTFLFDPLNHTAEPELIWGEIKLHLQLMSMAFCLSFM